jgi:protein tyrosine/serine phosphatase
MDKDGQRVPFSRSYWVVPEKFLAGFYPGSRNQDEAHQRLRALLNHGIRHMINLMEPDEKDWSGKPFGSYEDQMRSIAVSIGHTVTFDRMPIKDTRIPSRLDMCQILDRIDQCIENHKPVYIHCWGGRGRTGTVVGCFLARHGIASGGNVLSQIQELRKATEDAYVRSPETGQQEDMVVSWVEGE